MNVGDKVMLNMANEKVVEAFKSPMSDDEKFMWYTTVLTVEGWAEEEEKIIVKFPSGQETKLEEETLCPIIFTDIE
jgi:hypothetical protein